MPIKSNREYRAMKLETRAIVEGSKERKVRGHFTTYNEPYLLWSYSEPGYLYEFWEQVDREAFKDTDVSDVIFQYNHEGRVFARTANGTMELFEDEIGAGVEADLGGTEIGRQLWEEIDGKYTSKMSFGFTIAAQTREQTVEETDSLYKVVVLRTIKSVGKLYDVSAVSLPANDNTDIASRSEKDGEIQKALEEFKASRNKKIELARAKALAKLKSMEV